MWVGSRLGERLSLWAGFCQWAFPHQPKWSSHSARVCVPMPSLIFPALSQASYPHPLPQNHHLLLSSTWVGWLTLPPGLRSLVLTDPATSVGHSGNSLRKHHHVDTGWPSYSAAFSRRAIVFASIETKLYLRRVVGGNNSFCVLCKNLFGEETKLGWVDTEKAFPRVGSTMQLSCLVAPFLLTFPAP